MFPEWWRQRCSTVTHSSSHAVFVDNMEEVIVHPSSCIQKSFEVKKLTKTQNVHFVWPYCGVWSKFLSFSSFLTSQEEISRKYQRIVDDHKVIDREENEPGTVRNRTTVSHYYYFLHQNTGNDVKASVSFVWSLHLPLPFSRLLVVGEVTCTSSRDAKPRTKDTWFRDLCKLGGCFVWGLLDKDERTWRGTPPQTKQAYFEE